MRISWRWLWLVLWLWAPCALAAPLVLVLRVEGAIGPATADYVKAGLHRAEDEDAKLVVIEMDTPGGLDTAMRTIIQGILASPVPVAVYVTPAGARAASAGTYILYAAQIAAMTPGTNVGAATPVQIGGPLFMEGKTEERKIVNDAVAYIRALATLHGRNGDWAEKAVREAVSVPADQALSLHVIDYLAPNLDALLAELNGKTVNTVTGPHRLVLGDARVEVLEPGWYNRLLATLTDPNVAYILLIVGFYGLIFEMASPGMVFPGVLGAICLLLALFAFQVLPVNYAGLALIILALILFVAEAFVPSFGSLGLGGAVAFFLGSLILLEGGGPGFRIAWSLIITATLLSTGFFLAIVNMAIRARLRHVVSGREALVGAKAVAVEDFVEGKGRVRVQGEIWHARAVGAVRKGEVLQVKGVEGLTVMVEPEGVPESAKTPRA